MEPIISPWIIYWINVLDRLSIVTLTLTYISIIMILTCTILYFCSDIIEYSKDKIIHILKILIVVFAVSILCSVLIPTKNDMIAMLALSYITPDNINLVQDNIVEFIKRIMDIIQSGSN